MGRRESLQPAPPLVPQQGATLAAKHPQRGKPFESLQINPDSRRLPGP